MYRNKPKAVYLHLIVTCSFLVAIVSNADSRFIKKSDLTSLNNFQFQSGSLKSTGAVKTQAVSSPYVEQDNSMKLAGTSTVAGWTVKRYQQKYYGIEVFGASITVDGSEVNGKIEEAIEKDISPQDIAKYQDLQLQKQAAAKVFGDYNADELVSKLIIYPLVQDGQQKYVLAYFLQINKDDTRPTCIVDCKTSKVYKKWDSVEHFATNDCSARVVGTGGNIATGMYYYGFDGLKPLRVPVSGKFQYSLDDGQIVVVDMNLEKSTDDAGNEIIGPAFSWSGIPVLPTEYVNGSYNAKTDAYAFGQLTLAMYQNWLGEDAMPGKFVLRVHYAKLVCEDTNGDGIEDTCTLNKNYCNASWNNDIPAASFGNGDGEARYGYCILDVVGHELSHAYNYFCGGLVYVDQSGALNESFADIGSIAVLEYTRQNYPELYNSFYSKDNGQISWRVGEYLKTDGTALRYMDHPAMDGVSADCYMPVEGAERSYQDVVEAAQESTKVNSYIVHKASGIFNRAFYLFSQKWGIENAFKVFALANMKYWTPTIDFEHAASGVVSASQDFGYSADEAVSIFAEIGITPQ